MEETKFVIKYEVVGFGGEHSAGPYGEHTALSHLKDIAGYEEVRNVRLEIYKKAEASE